MLINLLLIASVALGTADEILRVSASMPPQLPAVGGQFEVQLQVDLADGWSADEAGMPGFVVQLGVPDAVIPLGKMLTDDRDLARNDFLQAPFERLIKQDHAPIEFVLAATPASDDVISVNVLAFLTHDDGQALFARRRIELPVVRGATMHATEQATKSDWGTAAAGLQIGDKVADFTLPRADGSTFTLSEHLGDSPVVITTYRAFW